MLEYIKSTQGEMRHVSWPNKRQVVIFTSTVIAVSVFVALVLGTLDFIFLRGLRSVIGSGANTPSVQTENTNTLPLSDQEQGKVENTQSSITQPESILEKTESANKDNVLETRQ
jgi:preprotein translocase SecE subunit